MVLQQILSRVFCKRETNHLERIGRRVKYDGLFWLNVGLDPACEKKTARF